MTILVDIDSTITDFGKQMLNYLNNRYQTNYKYEDITSWDWFDRHFNSPWKLLDVRSFWDKVQVNPEAIFTIESWVKQGHNVYLVTASAFNDTLGYKINKTLEMFDHTLINYRNIVVTKDKSIIKGDIMIDDNINNLLSFDGVRICYAQPWNQQWEHPHRYTSWEDIDDIIWYESRM